MKKTGNSNSYCIGAVMKLLKTNTTQRNIYNNGLQNANTKIRDSKELHFATLGRLVKYEGMSIIEEALEYAKNAGLFFECESKYIGVLTGYVHILTSEVKYQLHTIRYCHS